MNTTINQVTTNEELRTLVLREIEWRPDIRSQDINVKVLGDTVMLTGFVHRFAEKGSAERAAKSVRGVVSIANDIEVCPSTRTDPEIARDVQHVLKSHAMPEYVATRMDRKRRPTDFRPGLSDSFFLELLTAVIIADLFSTGNTSVSGVVSLERIT